MSFDNPALRIIRRSVEGMEGMYSKMFDPPTESPATPDLVLPTSPVPEVMAAAALLSSNPPAVAHTIRRQLMHGMTLPTWDGQDMQFFLFRDPQGINAAKNGSFPAPTNRVPRGSIFHCETDGSGPPPHTIHWHGQEPTPMNDGVGHCSMEVGHYVYQWQPNFIGSYFYHCHRNTMQHFEFGLYGFTIIDPPDAFFASITSINPNGSVLLSAIPIGACRDGKFRTAANLDPAINPAFGIYGQDNFNLITAPDPEASNPDLPAWLKFQTDPHAHTVAYDVEALWVLDDRDINWSNLAPNPFATFPKHGSAPGVNDDFHGNAGGGVGPNDFFAFNDFRSTHFYVTGVAVPDDSGAVKIPGSGEIQHGIVIPPELMSGVSGVQVSINAQVNENILIRVLDAAYNNARVTFPVDVVIIAWDGRALGVPPFTSYNEPVLVPAGTPMEWSVARRFDCIMRSAVPVNSFATVEFIDTLRRDVRFTARIPINIGSGVDVQTFAVSGQVKNAVGQPMAGVVVASAAVSQGGTEGKTAITNASGFYSISGLPSGTYQITPSSATATFESVLKHCIPDPENPDMCDLSYALVTVVQNGVIGVDFNETGAVVQTHSISGKVAKANSQGLSGVAVTMRGAAAVFTTVTDATGAYSFANLGNGTYTLTMSLLGYTFNPASMKVVLAGADVIDRNFTATEQVPVGVYEISGLVMNAMGAPLAGASVAMTGPVNSTAVTNASGAYAFANLPAGTYTVAPSLTGYQFMPVSKQLTITGESAGGLNFTGIQAVAGDVVTCLKARVIKQPGARQTGPRWRLEGKGTPRSLLTIHLGSDLTGDFLATVRVNKRGAWKLDKQIPVRWPMTATSISISSSGGGVLLNRALAKRNF